MSGFNKKRKSRSGSGSSRIGSSTGSSRGSGRSWITPTSDRHPHFDSDSLTGVPRSDSSSGYSRNSFDTALSLGASMNSIGSTYADMLNHNSKDDFTALLASLGINQEQGLSGSQRDDYNKQLLDMILKHYADLEQRGYNEQVLNEQRLYDNPLNQLARLMGAGISRDAAIQMLNSSGSGSGSGSALIGGAAADVSSGIPASQSQLNGIQSGTSIANTIFGGISAISGLVSLGFSVPQAIQQTRYLQNQNVLTGRQLSAYDSAGRAFSILNAAGATADAFGSVASAADAIRNLASSGNSDAKTFISSGGLQSMVDNAPFASQTLTSLYHTERASQDYATMFTSEVANMNADTDLKKVEKSNLTKQIHKFDAEISQLQASEEYQREMASLTRWQQKLTGAEIAKTNAEVDFIGKNSVFVQSQTLSQDLANNLQQSWQQSSIDGKSAVDWYTESVNNDLYIQVQSLAYQKDKELYKKQIDSMLANQESLTALYTLNKLYSNGAIASYNEGSEEYRDLIDFCNVCNETGVFEYIDAVTKASSSGHFNSSIFGSSTEVDNATEILETLDNRNKRSWKERWHSFNAKRNSNRSK